MNAPDNIHIAIKEKTMLGTKDSIFTTYYRVRWEICKKMAI